MSDFLQPKANFTLGRLSLHENMLYGLLIVGSICSFFYINCVLMFTLRSKQVFCETSRHILLFNLIFADIFQQVPSLLLYFLASFLLKIPFYACGIPVMLVVFLESISPLTLAVMSLERYVSVCHPLRHATIFTVRRTGTAISVVWTCGFIHILIRALMLVYVFTKISINLQMNDFCFKEGIFFAPIFDDFEKAHASALFLSVGAAIISSTIGVAIVARSASTEKESTKKALHTLLLHLIHLILILTASLFTTIIVAIARSVGRLTLLRIQNLFFVFLNILPRCLSTLIYGLRDKKIRPVLLLNLCCGWRSSVLLNK